jgi:hypothetical protein
VVYQVQRLRAGLWLGLAGLLACCGEDAKDPAAAAANGDEVAAHAYAMVTLRWSEDGPTGYVVLGDTPDPKDLTLDRAREFPGYTSIAVADQQLLVSPSWDDLTIERYRLTPQLDWQDNGRLSFVNEGVEAVSFQAQYMADDAAYLEFDVTHRVIWDPMGFELQGTRSDEILESKRDGLDLYANFNRTQFTFGDRILRPFSYHDEDWLRWSERSPIVVYNRETHDASEVIEAPCPALDSITRDERGNTYLGSFEYSALYPLMGKGPAPCAVRLTPDNKLDEDWDLDTMALTEGRHVVNFRYIGGGKAIAAVLHHEAYGEGFDFEALAENTDDFWDTTARNHKLWMFDVDSNTAAPVDGIDAFEFINPGFFHTTLDGRTFVFLGDGNIGSNNFDETVVYEIETTGAAKRRFTVPGTVTQWMQVR